ncbi:hypothetical protein L0B53_19300 (plasmid) [Vibrio sp. SS-MA-C1-2]|uniref:hypothetical protein n=1 Tax=Vibrio sp. SS-MA-C1-2 TaxID=2908646 RepID=UPI001F2B52F6|nr:hypothetical protein [Vibrio sp. SS-MA-C1-2]UJF20282.1 hypothetical protein L0B53_19300 [Vibrio sp. SS-MA-C1-2]
MSKMGPPIHTRLTRTDELLDKLGELHFQYQHEENSLSFIEQVIFLGKIATVIEKAEWEQNKARCLAISNNEITEPKALLSYNDHQLETYRIQLTVWLKRVK